MNAVSQWWIGGLRTRKAKVAGSIPTGGSKIEKRSNFECFRKPLLNLEALLKFYNGRTL